MNRFLKRKREEEDDEIIDLTNTPKDKAQEEKKRPLIISLGQNKGDFECPRIEIMAKTFPKTASCIDIVSFDVGTTHLAVARLRYDRERFQCCIVEAALIDIYNPWQSLRLDAQFRSQKGRKQRKPAHVEPFCGAEWPATAAKEKEEEKQQELYQFHADMLVKKRVAREEASNESLQWTHDVEMLSLALHWVPWLHDHQIDHVLVEQQQHDNTKMRCISYCLLDMFQTRRLIALSLSPLASTHVPSISKQAVLELFPSTLKLSQWVINVLLQSWTVLPDPTLEYSAPDKDEQEEEEDEEDEEEGKEKGVKVRTLEEVETARKERTKKNRNNTMLHDDLVDHATHGTKKQSASRVLTYFFTPRSPSPDRKPNRQHPFFNWLSVQRAEKHNVCDAVLQAFAFIIKNEQQPQMVRQRKKRAKAASKTKTSTSSRSALSLSAAAPTLALPPSTLPAPLSMSTPSK